VAVTVPSVSATVATPVATVKTPPTPSATVAASASASPQQGVSAGATVSSAPVQASAQTSAGASSGGVQASVTAGAQAAGAPPVGASASVGGSGGTAASVAVGGTAGVSVGPGAAVAVGPGTAASAGSSSTGGSPSGSGPVSLLLAPLAAGKSSIAGASSTVSRAATSATSLWAIPVTGSAADPAPPASSTTILLSPLANQLASVPVQDFAPTGSASVPQSPQAEPAARDASGWTGTDTRRVALGGALAALLALGALGLAAVGRSPAALAACAELSRFPFPRFRILPCPGSGRSAGTALEAGAAGGAVGPRPTAIPTSINAGAGPGEILPPVGHGPGILVPRIGRIIGGAISKVHPWDALKALALGLLALANGVLLAIRWRIGRLHAQ